MARYLQRERERERERERDLHYIYNNNICARAKFSKYFSNLYTAAVSYHTI
ncbi:MAG: hypothetical protein LBL24_02435 [Bacteroidales bacterium]|nr:hypothetical protein [Bacteroidales bacterium]